LVVQLAAGWVLGSELMHLALVTPAAEHPPSKVAMKWRKVELESPPPPPQLTV
jgi:hypothetical protein